MMKTFCLYSTSYIVFLRISCSSVLLRQVYSLLESDYPKRFVSTNISRICSLISSLFILHVEIRHSHSSLSGKFFGTEFLCLDSWLQSSE